MFPRGHITFAWKDPDADGVAVVDLSDPYRADPNNPFGKLDADGNGTDDRIMGYLDVNTYSRAAIVVDSETGIIFTGEGGVKAGVNAVGAQKPKLEFLLDDPAHPGHYQAPGYLSAFQADQPRLGLWVPGGQGTSVNATLQLYDRRGFEESRQVIGQDAQGNDLLAPVSTVYRTVTLKRQSDDKTSNRYNFYIQGNQSQQNVVKLGMMYDAANPDPTLMVSKQSGSLKGEVALSFANNPFSWCGSSSQSQGGRWNSFVSVRTPVSRPWVEWKSDTLDDTSESSDSSASKGSQAATKASDVDPVVTGYDGPHFIGVYKPRTLTMRYQDYAENANTFHPANPHYPMTLSFSLQNPSEASITPLSPMPVSNGVTISDRQVWGTKVSLRIQGLQSTSVPEGNRLIITAHYASGGTRIVGSYPIWVINSGMAVDYNRDGTIEFDDPQTHTSPDHVPADKHFAFWLNNNYDTQKSPDKGDGANLKAYQDEVHDRTHINNGQLELQPDSMLNRIAVERDLEDFSPLYIKKVPSMGKGTSEIQYFLYFKGTDGTPSIKVFRPVIPTVSEQEGQYTTPYPLYFMNPTFATKQLDADYLGTALSVEYKKHPVLLPHDLCVINKEAIPLMFEGVTAGTGSCVLELRYKGTPLARYKVPIELKPVGEFVEEYSVSQPDDYDQDHDPLSTPQTEHIMPDPTANGSHDYILWVHGWNWADWQKKAYGYSTFKRLYWLGYKGTFGIFKWPDTYGLTSALTFDESERHALLSGEGLKNLILGLKTRGFNVNIYAHSQGCMVTSEALRQIALDDAIQKPVVDSMTFSQAAVSARMYDGNYPEYDDWSGLANNLLNNAAGKRLLLAYLSVNGISNGPLTFLSKLEQCFLDRSQWPDLEGHFPYYLERPGYPGGDYAPYFQPVQNAVVSGKMFNFYNQHDYPTGDWNDKEGLMNRVSGSWLVDQLIKPYRAMTWPFYSDRAFQMVYGMEDLGPESKKYFTRDTTRTDYYSLVGRDWTCGGALGSLVGDPIFDFTDPVTKYKMLAYGCPSYSRSLGGHTTGQHLSASSGFVADKFHDVDLHAAPYYYGKFVMWHGAQFRGMLADQRPYWELFLSHIGSTTP